MEKQVEYYYEKLEEIKKRDQTDFIKIHINNKTIILRAIDDSDSTVKLLTKCRLAYRNWFGSDFKISELKTIEWIRNGIMNNIDRSLFIIFFQEQKIGCIGTIRYNKEKNSAALDAMMKDPDFEFPKLMEIVEKVFLRWMFEKLKIVKITGYLFQDNHKMMHVHKNCGWKKVNEIPLKLVKTKEGTRWEEMEKSQNNPERFFDEIEITYKNLMQNFGNIEYEFLDNELSV